jgi:hypothetical protein
LKQKGKSGRVEVGAKNEKAEQELEGKLLPFFTFLFFSMVFFFFVFFNLLLEKKKMPRERIEIEG